MTEVKLMTMAILNAEKVKIEAKLDLKKQTKEEMLYEFNQTNSEFLELVKRLRGLKKGDISKKREYLKDKAIFQNKLIQLNNDIREIENELLLFEDELMYLEVAIEKI